MFHLWDFTTHNIFWAQISHHLSNTCSPHWVLPNSHLACTIPVCRSTTFQNLTAFFWQNKVRKLSGLGPGNQKQFPNLSLKQKAMTIDSIYVNNQNDGLLTARVAHNGLRWSAWTTFQAGSGLRLQGLTHHRAHSGSKAVELTSRSTKGTSRERVSPALQLHRPAVVQRLGVTVTPIYADNRYRGIYYAELCSTARPVLRNQFAGWLVGSHAT
jgi:hypothetical protein